jgi:anti-sigma factor RsiW
MSNHLTHDQFEICVLGQARQEELEHIRQCPACRAEFEHFRKVLSLFRSVVWDRVDDRLALPAVDVTALTPAAAGFPGWRLALVAAAFVAMVVIPFFMTKIIPEQTEPPSAEMSPEAVMERLNRNLLRMMPAPMEPVMSLIPSEQFASKPGRIQ